MTTFTAPNGRIFTRGPWSGYGVYHWAAPCVRPGCKSLCGIRAAGADGKSKWFTALLCREHSYRWRAPDGRFFARGEAPVRAVVRGREVLHDEWATTCTHPGCVNDIEFTAPQRDCEPIEEALKYQLCPEHFETKRRSAAAASLTPDQVCVIANAMIEDGTLLIENGWLYPGLA